MLKLLLLLVVLGLAVYLTVRLLQGGLPGRAGAPRRPVRRPPAPRRPQGPDDDEDFLRDLERRNRHREEPDT